MVEQGPTAARLGTEGRSRLRGLGRRVFTWPVHSGRGWGSARRFVGISPPSERSKATNDIAFRFTPGILLAGNRGDAFTFGIKAEAAAPVSIDVHERVSVITGGTIPFAVYISNQNIGTLGVIPRCSFGWAWRSRPRTTSLRSSCSSSVQASTVGGGTVRCLVCMAHMGRHLLLGCHRQIASRARCYSQTMSYVSVAYWLFERSPPGG